MEAGTDEDIEDCAVVERHDDLSVDEVVNDTG